MKKTISLMLCLLLIFSSVNLVFAVDWSTTDQNNLQSIKNAVNSGGILYSIVNTINNNILALLRIDDADVGRQTITWWVREAVKDLDIIAGSGTGTISFNVNEILNQLSYFSSGGARQSYLKDILTNSDLIYARQSITNSYINSLKTDVTDIKGYELGILGYNQNIDTTTNTYLPYLSDLRTALTNEPYYNVVSGLSVGWSKHFAHRSLFRSIYDSSSFVLENGYYNLPSLTSSGDKTDQVFAWNYGTPLGNLALMLQQLVYNEAMVYKYRWSADLTGYNSTQTAKNWLTLQNKTFTPISQTNGLYTWLSNIQEPIARLSYVHASDEEIAAREKAAANQTAVVNNFIDSNGSGAAPASSFGDVASMSAGYSSNMNTDASASGIWNIFNSNNFGWFSLETANQLDTTVSTRKGSSDFETPLLDQQISDIYKELGVDVND